MTQGAENYTPLRNDPDALISLLVEKEEVTQSLKAKLAAYENEIVRLQHIITTANRKQFVTKSDKIFNQNQEPLFGFPLSLEPEIIESEQVLVVEHTREAKKGRKPLSPDLERERIEYLPENTKCATCGEELSRIGEEVTEELEYVPAKFKVVEHARIKCACSKCKAGVICEPLPAAILPLERARPGVSLLVYILLAKYVDHLPLYRLEQMFLRDGAVIARQRMCDWVRLTCELLEPLYRELGKEALVAKYLQADETTIKVQDAEVKEKCLTGYLWSLHVPNQIGFFRYFGTRSSEAAAKLLSSFKGTLQTDLYAGYNTVLLGGEVNRLACMAHIRRKFTDAAPTAPQQCKLVIEEIKKLYEVEEKSKKLSPEDRYKQRTEKAKPVLDRLREYLEKLNQSSLPRAPLKEALEYALKQWREVERYLEDGSFEIDNNAIERQIRPVAIGRKNWLFAGSHEGAERAAMLYSFFATCKIHGVNPHEWLTFVLRNISTPGLKARDLLPHRFKKTAAQEQAGMGLA